MAAAKTAKKRASEPVRRARASVTSVRVFLVLFLVGCGAGFLNGVKIKHWAQPSKLIGQDGQVKEIEFEYTQLDDGGRLMGTGDHFTLLVDQVFKAIGQTFVPAPLMNGAAEVLEVSGGRIAVDEDRKTSLPDVWAGGDCVAGDDLTVSAVQDGKVAAVAIDRQLRG